MLYYKSNGRKKLNLQKGPEPAANAEAAPATATEKA